MMKTIFITGVSGYVGSHLAKKFLGSGDSVIGLARAGNNVSASSRVKDAIHAISPDSVVSFANLSVISGDIRDQPGDIIEKLRELTEAPVDEVWHCAASFKFTEADRQESVSINIAGVDNMLSIVDRVNSSNPPRYFHVSTAYCSGAEYAIVPEQKVDRGETFRSVYEWSKNQGERLVYQHQERCGHDSTIFRPTIVVGSPESRALNQTAYYQVVEAVFKMKQHRIKQRKGDFDGNLALRMIGDPQVTPNIIPVDFLVDAMTAIAADTALQNSDLKIFNIANDDPPSLASIIEVGCESLDVHGFELVPASEMGPDGMSRLERSLAKLIAFQAPYLMETMTFELVKFKRQIKDVDMASGRTDPAFISMINEIFLDHLESMQ